MKKLILFVLLAFFISASLSKANVSMDNLEKLKKSTAIVYTVFMDSDFNIIGYKVGTGFFVNDPEDCILVTAFHVVSDYDAPEGTKNMGIAISYGYDIDEEVDIKNLKYLTEIFPLTGNEKKYYEIDADYDLIVFDLKDKLKKYPLDAMTLITKSKDLPKTGEYVATMGHTEGIIFNNLAEGKVTSVIKPFIITNFPNVSYGNSGGCVMNDDGKCIGFIDAKMEGGVLLQFVIPSTYIYPLILKLQASSKGEEKTLNSFIPSDEFKGQVILGDPGFKLK